MVMSRLEYVKIFCAGALAAGVLCGATLTAAAAGHGGRAVHAGILAHGLAAPSPRTSRATAVSRAIQASQSAGRTGASEPITDHSIDPGTTPFAQRPWIEGYEPLREDELFRAVYSALPSHNVLKVYATDAGSYDTAGIRFSARVPHTMRDIDVEEMQREAATLVRTAFERFPDLQTLDVWATIPVEKTEATSIEATVFSVSADRATYLEIRDRGLTDPEFLAAFGRVWIAPQVPR